MLFVLLIFLVIALINETKSFSRVSLQKINTCSITTRYETTRDIFTIILLDDDTNLPLLPSLTIADLNILREGGRVQQQTMNGRTGYGFVVVDVKAPLQGVFEKLQTIDEYDKCIPIVKSVTIYSCRNDEFIHTEFSLSKFNLKVNVVNEIITTERFIKFSLDQEKPNFVLKKAEGFWHVVDLPDRPGYTRVYLSASATCSAFVPTLIVDYAASRALSKATTWLRPFFEGTPYISNETE